MFRSAQLVLARYRSAAPDCESLPTAPILQPKPADANELPRIMRHNFESAPQGTHHRTSPTREHGSVGLYDTILQRIKPARSREYAASAGSLPSAIVASAG